MLTILLDGRSFTAGELAQAANVSAQSASMHLAQLLNGGLVQVGREGRYRHYRIASPEVGYAIEALGVISTPHKPETRSRNEAIYLARTCYDHLAGEVAVRLADTFQHKGVLIAREREYELTPLGELFLKQQWKIDVTPLRGLRRNFARRCLDWTQKREHVAGALGAAIYRQLLEFRWMSPEPNSRVVRLTTEGREHLDNLFKP